MAWSTRELAELAGTTVRAVRHYHEVGLLEEPRRRANGYKQYGVAHLVRTVRIRRLAELGFSLPQIAELGDADQHPRDALRTLDTQLTQTLHRLYRARVEVHQLLGQAAPTDLPTLIAAQVREAELSRADRCLLIVMSRVLVIEVVTAFVDTLRALPPSATAGAFDRLPADADEATRRRLVTDLLDRHETARTTLAVLWNTTARSDTTASRTVDDAVRDLYNPAQYDVLCRIRVLLRSHPTLDPVEQPVVAVDTSAEIAQPGAVAVRG